MADPRHFLTLSGRALRRFMFALIVSSFCASNGAAQVPIPGWTPDSEWPPLPPQLTFEKPRDAAEGRRQDLRAFHPLLYLNRSFTFAARSEAESLLVALDSAIDVMPDVQFQIGLHRIAALGNNPHSSIREGGFARNFGALPIRGYFFEEGYHVLRTAPGHEDLLGAHLTTIDGHTLDTVLAATRDLVGGPDVYFRTVQADLLFTVPALLHALGVAERDDRLTLGKRSFFGAFPPLLI